MMKKINQKKQVISLIKQELKQASRSKYIILTFLVLPLAIWGLQGMEFMLIDSMVGSINYEDDQVYIVNYDEGNATTNMGRNIITSLLRTTVNESKNIYGVDLTNLDDVDPDEIFTYMRENKVSPLIIIYENFTASYTLFNGSDPNSIPPVIDIAMFPEDRSLAYTVLNALTEITGESPYTIYEVLKESVMIQSSLAGPGEESASNTFFNVIIIMMSVVLSVVSPAAYISAAITQEKEKKTLESLLSLPISRTNILIAKITAGVSLMGLFSLANIVGLNFFKIMVSNAQQEEISSMGTALTPELIALVSASMFLSGLVSIGLGIAIVSMVNDVKAAENVYVFSMMVPAIAVVSLVMSGGLPESIWPYLIPWSNTLAILIKLLYPVTYEYSMLSSSMGLDIVLHFLYLIVFMIVSLIIAGKMFNREKMIL
ncbi:MAG: ABC transporter permease [Candidatus Heimdallarchaeota archaeon]|nr:ABC transporter permease [Candidatus Heimdallarchaeota archaeon]